jgi:hypothetical protein
MPLSINVSNAKLFSNLSYKEYFDSYNPYIDGQVFIATYGFIADNFQFWEKLEPLSVLYVHERHKLHCQNFLKRFPLFEVYAVPNLHTKAIFFYDSGRLLLGSENLCLGKSTYSELMIETIISQDQKKDVIDFVFRSLGGRILTCYYGLNDVRLTENGYPYLPCENEVDYWDLISHRIGLCGKPPNPEFHSPSYIYLIMEYDVDGKRHALAFNRGYAYCGDISIECFDWLVDNCEIINDDPDGSKVPFSSPSELTDTSPRKDYFLTYHPVASRFPIKRAFWLDKVKNIKALRHIIQPVILKEITTRKIRRK